ncbi:MAG: ABC transporter permease, partial [Bacteroidota bacterium]
NNTSKMFNSFLKIAFRNFTRSKGNALLNVLGLATGITCCLLIFEYVAYERSYESFNPDAGRIIRVQDEEYQNGQMIVPCAAAMPGVAPAMKREFPEIENAARLRKISILLGNDTRNIQFHEASVYYADQAVIPVFHLRLIKGNEKTALIDPGKILLSETLARKYFGKDEPMGKVLTVHIGGKLRPLEVTGVFRDYPDNSHIRFGVLISYPSYSRVIGTADKADDPLETSFG